MLIAINKDCYFCNASAPFYRRLADVAQMTNAHLVVISGNTVDESKQYLGVKQIPIHDVYQKTLSDLNIHATPTLVLVDANGVTTHVWRGQLQSQLEQEVIDAVRGTPRWTF